MRKSLRAYAYNQTAQQGMGVLTEVAQGPEETARALVCSSDVCQEGTVQRSGGYYRRRLFTTYILHRYDSRRRDTAAEAMQTCREVLRQFHSRFLRDEPELRGSLNYLRTEDIRTHEFGADMFNGFAGLSFLISIDEPADLQYRPNEWEE